MSSTPRFLTAAALLVSLVIAPRTAAAESGWGLAVGLGAPLAPADDLGVTVGVSAFALGGEDGPAAMFRFRGELLGVITAGPWAIMPTLTGDLGVDLGRASLFLQGGVQLFGFSSRDDYIVFATLGLVGGLGLVMAAAIGILIFFAPDLTGKLCVLFIVLTISGVSGFMYFKGKLADKKPMKPEETNV